MIRYLLVDDRTAVRTSLYAALAAHPDFLCIGEAGGEPEAWALLAQNDYDVAFVGEGFAGNEPYLLLPRVRREARAVVLLHAETPTLLAADPAGVDFVPCPPRPEHVARLLPRLRLAFAPTSPLAPIRIGALTRLIAVDDVTTIDACENYTELKLASGERHLVRRTMQQWAALLPARQFARVHRGLIANLARIERMERGVNAATVVRFASATPASIVVKRRHWAGLRRQLEFWRALATRPLEPGAERSVAVLPFANFSADRANEIFCDGISEELMNLLAKTPGLRVAARTSAFYFKGRNVPVNEIARQLGVDFIVEGSVRKDGDRARISVQLIDGHDGFQTWSGHFDRHVTDILAVQDEIAGLVAGSLHLTLAAGSRRPATFNPEAHWLALEGRHFWSLGTADGFRRAEAAYRKALSIDPGFATGHAGIADVLTIRALYQLADGRLDVQDDIAAAREAARRALELDSTLAEPQAALGFLAFLEGRLAEAERTLVRALAMNPNYATGHQFHAWALCATGQLDRGLDVYRQSIARDPLSFINIDRYAAILALADRLEDALAINERAAALRPDIFVGNLSQRAPILFGLGRVDEAVEVARTVRHTGRGAPYRRNADADAIYVLHRAGHDAEAAEYAREMQSELSAGNYLHGFLLSALGRFDDALPYLRLVPTIMLPWLYWSEIWDPVRDTRMFVSLIQELGRAAEYEFARHTHALVRPGRGDV